MPYKFILNKSLNWSLVDKDNSVIVENLTDEEKSKLEELIEHFTGTSITIALNVFKKAAKDLELNLKDKEIDQYFEDNY